MSTALVVGEALIDIVHRDGAAPVEHPGGNVIAEYREQPGVEGAPGVRVLLLRPKERAYQVVPAALVIHGGGMVLDSAEQGPDLLFLDRVAAGEMVAVSVDYRLVPEHPNPAPIDDCFATLHWISPHAAELGADPERLTVCGIGALGGLVAGTVLRAHDSGLTRISHQILICPMLDDRMTTHSSQMLLDEGGWDRESNTFGRTALLGDRLGTDDVSPYAAPARATDLTGLPRTYIDCGSAETFRDEILDYSQHLSKAGVSVDLLMWGGGFHGFDNPFSTATISRASRWVRDEFITRAAG